MQLVIKAKRDNTSLLKSELKSNLQEFARQYHLDRDKLNTVDPSRNDHRVQIQSKYQPTMKQQIIAELQSWIDDPSILVGGSFSIGCDLNGVWC